MEKVVVAIVLYAVFFGIRVSPTQAAIRRERPNAIGCELLGKGGLGSVNFEHYFNPHFSGGIGLMASLGDEELFLVFPLYVSFLSGDMHNLYLGAGKTFSSSGNDYSDRKSESVSTFSWGYQFQSPTGYYVRPYFTIFDIFEPEDPNPPQASLDPHAYLRE